MVKITVSAIIPLFKVRDYIGKCCDSLFNQTLKNVEYVFVNDSTPDDSVDVIKEKLEQYPSIEPFVKIVNHPQNMGVAEARNTGLRHASGEYVVYVDADDWIENDMFAELYSTAVAANLDIVGCDWYLEYPQRSRVLRQFSAAGANEAFRAMLKGQLRWYLWAFMIRREFIIENELGFLRGYNIGEDMSFLLKGFAVAQSYAHVSKPLYHHTLYNENSLTRMDSIKQFEIVRHNVEDALGFIQTKHQQGYDLELACYKLTVKFPLLISLQKRSYELWNTFYNDVHWAIWKNDVQPVRNKFIQWLAANRVYSGLYLYNAMFKFVNHLLYR